MIVRRESLVLTTPVDRTPRQSLFCSATGARQGERNAACSQRGNGPDAYLFRPRCSPSADAKEICV